MGSKCLAQAVTEAASRARSRTRNTGDILTLDAGIRLSRFAQPLIRRPRRGERVVIPTPTRIDGFVFHVVEDLVAYTGLARAQVLALLRREHENFRLEWHVLAPAMRNGRWYYL
jgi:hypothetical protein